MEPIAGTVDGTLRQLRVIHSAFCVTVLLYGYVVFTMPVQGVPPLDPSLFKAIVAIAVVDAGVAFWLRKKFLQPAFEGLRVQPGAVDTLGGWMKGSIISDVCAEVVVLFGVVLHFFGGTNEQVVPFLVVGAALLAMWWPQRP
jgi:hypothetical protein